MYDNILILLIIYSSRERITTNIDLEVCRVQRNQLQEFMLSSTLVYMEHYSGNIPQFLVL